jgi:hypothetical protein
LDIKNREEFLKLPIKDRIDYINSFTSKGINTKDIAQRLNVNPKTLSKSFTRAGYYYSREDKIYKLAEGQETQESVTLPQHQQTTTTEPQHKENTNTTSEHQGNTLGLPPEEVKAIRELLEIKDKLIALVELSPSKRKLEIEQSFFKGKLSSRNFKIYDNVRVQLDRFIKKNSLYKTQDIVNYALLFFLQEFDK